MFLYKKLYPHLVLKIAGPNEEPNYQTQQSNHDAQYNSVTVGAQTSTITIPEKVSYTDFLIFFQKSISDHLLTINPSQGSPKNVETSLQHEIPTIALALRITVEIFRVLSQDEEMVTARTIINYFNQTELVPYTISQLMDLFEIYDSDNLQSLEILRMSNLTKASPALLLLCSGGSTRRGCVTNKEMIDKALMLRSYTLLEFIQKFCRRIENALKNSLGMQFITQYCL
jgi:hypothetical protein